MRMVIVFDGGTGGGVLLTDTGATPLQPFDRSIRLSLRAAAAIVNAGDGEMAATARRKLARQAVNLCNLAVEQVEEVVGPLDPERSLIFQDEDGGFVCGSTGKPPIPLPWPLTPPSLGDAVASGAIDADTVTLLQAARAQGFPLLKVFENPEKAAGELGLRISQRGVDTLQALAPSNLKQITDGVDREIVKLLHKVVQDGRFLDTWYLRPYETARTLKVKISDEALERLAMGGAGAVFRGDPQAIYIDKKAIAAGIIWAGVCIAVGTVAGEVPDTGEETVVDRSGAEKL